MQEETPPDPVVEESEEEQEEEHVRTTYMNYSSLFLFSNKFKPRVWAHRLIETKIYNFMIVTIILLNCILLACWDPLDPDAKEKRNQVITYIDFIFLIIYTIEAIFYIFIRGLVLHPKSYLRDAWSYIDIVVVVIGWLGIIFAGSAFSTISPLRALRALKPIRLVSGIQQIRRIIDAVLMSLPFLLSAVLLMSVFFVLYGIFGVILFNGALRYHCVMDGEFDENNCCNEDPGIFGGYECKDSQGKCRLTDENIDYGYFNFDNVFNSWVAIFMVINVEGWTRWAYITMDATSNLAAFYFVALIILGAIFWVNMLLAVISVSVSNLPESPKIKKKLPNVTLQRIVKKIIYYLKRTKPPNIFYRLCYRIIFSKVFETILMIVIVINLIALAMPFRHQPFAYELTIFIINLCCLIFFTFEMFLRLFAKGIYKYVTGLRNIIDLIVVVTGWIEVLLVIILGFDSSSSIGAIRVLRALRLIRVLKLARKWEGLQHVLKSIIIVLPTIFFFMVLFGVITATFMLIGIQLFGGQMVFDGEVPRYNFDSLYWSFVTLFVVVTGEQWPAIIFNGMRVHYWFGLIYFVIWKSLSTYILLNLFLSLLIDSFESARKQREEESQRKKKEPPKEIDEYDEMDPYEVEMVEIKESSTETDHITDVPIPVGDSDPNSAPTTQKKIEQENSDAHETGEETPGGAEKPLQITSNFEDTFLARLLQNPIGDNRPVAPTIFGCFKDSYPPRKQIIAIVRSSIFEWMMIMIVLLSCIALIIFAPPYSTYSTRGWIDFSLSLAFAILFTIEMIMRMISFGIIVPRGAYFRNAWDFIDFCVVIISWISIGLSFLPSKTYILIAFRSFRAIRILSRFEGTRLVVLVIIESLQVVPHIFLISIFFWSTFAIAGLQLFVGQYYYCENSAGEFVDTVDDLDTCEKEGFSFEPWPSNFANVGEAMLTIVRAASVNFPDPMIHGVDVAGEDENPIRDNHPEYAIFWVAFIIICSWFILGLFLGSIVETFNNIREQRNIGTSIFLSEKQREWIQLQRVLFTLKPPRNSKPASDHFLRIMVFEIVESDMFNGFILAIILLSIGVQCTFHFQQAWTWTILQNVTVLVVTIIFILEALAKIFALGIRGYFRSNWNKFDFLVVVISTVDVILLFVIDDDSANVIGIVRLLRIIRILRFLRLVKFSRRMQVLIKSSLLSAATLFNIICVMLVVFFIYAVIAISVFWDIPQSDDVDDPINRTSNWQDFPHALFLCFRLITGETWDLVQAEAMEENTIAGVLWFLTFIFLLNLLLMNLIVAVLYENLGLLVSFNFTGTASQADINNFIHVWRKFDPYGSKFIAEEDFPKFLMLLKPPLGVGNISPAAAQRVVDELEVPVTRNGTIYFPDALIVLCERLYDIDASEVFVASVMKGWKKAYRPIDVVKGRRRIDVWNDS